MAMVILSLTSTSSVSVRLGLSLRRGMVTRRGACVCGHKGERAMVGQRRRVYGCPVGISVAGLQTG